MNQDLITQYEIVFQNQIIKIDGFPAEIYKVPFSIDNTLAYFLRQLETYDINGTLLPAINEALATPNSKIEIEDERYTSILIYQDRAELYNDDYEFLYKIPTQDLKEIVIAWRYFLLTPPLNGTKGWHNFGPNCVLIDHSTEPIKPIKTIKTIEIPEISDEEFNTYSKQNKISFVIWTILFVPLFILCIIMPSFISGDKIIPISILGVICMSYCGYNALLYYKSWERNFIALKGKPEFHLDMYFLVCFFPSIIFYFIIYWNFIEGSGHNLYKLKRDIRFIEWLFKK